MHLLSRATFDIMRLTIVLMGVAPLILGPFLVRTINQSLGHVVHFSEYLESCTRVLLDTGECQRTQKLAPIFNRSWCWLSLLVRESNSWSSLFLVGWFLVGCCDAAGWRPQGELGDHRRWGPRVGLEHARASYSHPSKGLQHPPV